MKTILAAIAALFIAAPAVAQQVCGPVDDILTFLAVEHDEAVLVVGDLADGSQAVFTADPNDGSWTLLGVQAGTACLVADGMGWAPGDGLMPVGDPA